MTTWTLATTLVIGMLGAPPCAPPAPDPVQVRVPLNASGELDLAVLVRKLAEATGLDVAPPRREVTLPFNGLTGGLARKLIADALGADVTLRVEGPDLVVTIAPALLGPDHRPEWQRRLHELAAQARKEADRRSFYGFHALKSYRPNDSDRPTVCLVHGINSTAEVFVHMVKPIEEAGFGIVVFDYPFNRRLDESSRRFARDWAAFRKANGETRPWAVVGHSMGCLVARSYIEGESYGGDVSSFVMIAPVNQGSYLSRTQTLVQLMRTLQAAGDPQSTRALSYLSDGLGASAADMLPESAFLKGLNARPRRKEVDYHILAGDSGFLSVPARRQVEETVNAARRSGVLRVFVELAIRNGLNAQLDELTEGTGDGCVSVDRTRLDGVKDHQVIHANHVELIRAPLFFPEPGPVASMPFVLRGLGKP